MKTNKIFLSLLVASAAAVFVTSCGEDKVDYIEGKKIHDTLPREKLVEIVIMGVNTVDICADRADNVIKFDASGDWTWTLDAKDTWIESTTLSGAKGAGVLKFTVQENSEIKERRAVTTLKINGHDNTLTIVQKGSAPYVAVYNDKIMLSKTMKQAYIENIVSNTSDLIVGGMPDWIESVEITALEDYPGAHQAFVTLKDWSFDSEVRSGPIRFESASNPEIFKEYTIECALYDEKYIVDRGTTEAALPAKLLSGEAVTAKFSVYSNPDQGNISIVALNAVTVNNVTRYHYLGEDPWVTVSSVPTRVAYNETNYQVTCKDNLFVSIDESAGPRRVAIYAMPETEAQAFIDAAIAAGENGVSATPTFTIDQQLYVFLEEITAARPKFVYGTASTGVFNYRVHQGYTLKAEMISGGNNQTREGETWEPWPSITCSVGEPSAPDAEGWITYPVTVSYDGTKAASDEPADNEIQIEAYNNMKVTCLDAEGNAMPDSEKPMNIVLMAV